MAKTMYLTDAAATAHRGNNDAKLNAATSFWAAKLLSENHGATTGTTVTATATTVAGATPGVEVGAGAIPYEWLSEPLSADFTISGTVTLNLWAAESSNSANAAVNATVDKVDGATGAITRIATSARTTEAPLTTPTAATFTVAPTSTACKRGDRLRVRVFADDAGTMGTGFTFTLWYDRSTAAQGESYVTFTENLTFEPTGDPGSKNQTDATGGANPLGDTFSVAELSQPFVAFGSLLTGANARLSKLGAPTDNLVVTVETDSGGFPSGTVVGTVATMAGTSLTTTVTQYTWSGLSIALTLGATYHLHFVRSGAHSSVNYYGVAGSFATAAGWSPFVNYLYGQGWSSAASASLAVGVSVIPSTYYLTDTAETINPGAATEKKALTTQGSGSVNAVTNTAAGPTAGIQATASAGGTAIEWYTPPLNAFTLGGKAKLNIRALESSAAANASLKAEIAVTATDGTGATVWGIANVEAITTNGSRGELAATDGAVIAWVSGDDTAVTAGQRLRFRVYVDDCGDAALVTGSTVTVSYNGASAAAAGDSYVILPVLVTEQGGVTVTKKARVISSRVPAMRAALR